VTGPSSTPRGEHAGRPGTGWEQQLVRGLEIVVEEDDGNPFAWDEPQPGEYRPNRATRRATRRAQRQTGPRATRESHGASPSPHAGAQTIHNP